MSTLGSATPLADREAKHKIYGVVVGIVTDNVDTTDSTFRVRVRFPHIDGGGESEYDQASQTEKETHQSYWARIATFSAGEYISNSNTLGPRGALFMPEIDDEVLVAFEHGDIARPIVIGRLWSDVSPDKKDPGKPNRPIYNHVSLSGELATAVTEDRKGYLGSDGYVALKQDAKKNDVSGFRTRSSHVLVFDDNKDAAGVILRTGKNHRIELLDGNNKGVILADADGNYVWLRSGSQSGDIEIKTKGNIRLTADQNIELTAKKQIVTTSSAETKMTSTGAFTIDSKASLTAKAAQDATVQAGSALTLKGNPVNIN